MAREMRIFVMLILMSITTMAQAERVIRIGLTPVFLDDQVQVLRDWRAYLETRLGNPVQFVQRQTYREITDLLLQGELDAAWLCGFPYVRNRDRLTLLAVPVYRNQPLYESYLIVSADEYGVHSMEDLRGEIFAFSDPDSNSGYLYPAVQIKLTGARLQDYFARTFFTWGHRGVIQAVADGLATAGAVDGYVWDSLKAQNPELVGKTRVVARSPSFGFPPFVQLRGREQSNQALGALFLSMAQDAAGQEILRELNLQGFVEGEDRLYDGIGELYRLYLESETDALQ